jgi:tRNA-dihydrouridine synthase
MPAMSLYRPLKFGKLALDGNVFFAPSSGVSTSPVRKLAREFGANLVDSEMIKAAGVVHGKRGSPATTEMDPGTSIPSECNSPMPIRSPWSKRPSSLSSAAPI